MKEGCLDMESITLEKFVKDRIQENKDLFTAEEMKLIGKHKRCIHKVYLLGVTDGRECYKKREITD